MEGSSNIEWPRIKSATFILILCTIISGILIGFTYYFRGEMQLKFTQNKQGFQSISQRYLAVDQEEKNIREFYPAFAELNQRGIIGREHRLNWIEVLRSSGKDIKLPSLSYDIESQIEDKNEYSINLGSYKLFRSNMKLSLRLLHEGDLFRLINRLNEEANGHYSIRECEFRREGTEIKPDPSISNVNAQCTLNWYSIKRFDGTDLSMKPSTS